MCHLSIATDHCETASFAIPSTRLQCFVQISVENMISSALLKNRQTGVSVFFLVGMFLEGVAAFLRSVNPFWPDAMQLLGMPLEACLSNLFVSFLYGFALHWTKKIEETVSVVASCVCYWQYI